MEDDTDGSIGMHKCLSQHSKFWGTEQTFFKNIRYQSLLRVAAKVANKVGHICIDPFNVTDKHTWL